MTYYKASESYIHKTIVNDDFLIPVGNQAIKRNGLVMMNETALLLWNELKAGKTAEELCAVLSEHYNTESENVTEDVKSFIERMIELDAVEEICSRD